MMYVSQQNHEIIFGSLIWQLCNDDFWTAPECILNEKKKFSKQFSFFYIKSKGIGGEAGGRGQGEEAKVEGGVRGGQQSIGGRVSVREG